MSSFTKQKGSSDMNIKRLENSNLVLQLHLLSKSDHQVSSVHTNYSSIFEAPWYVGLCCRTPHLSQPCLSPVSRIVSENCKVMGKKQEDLTFISRISLITSHHPLSALLQM
jgi:hypothetical protein